MRIAIVGVSGLIGTALAQACVERGDTVVGVVRSPRPSRWSEQVVWDPSTAAAPPGVFAGCDAVVNLAGAPIAQRWSDSAWAEIVASRVDASANIARAVAADTVPVLVNASAVGYYGATEDPVDERSSPGPGPLAELSVRWESATAPARDGGARVVVIRTGVVLARDGGALERMLTPARLGLGGPIGGGRQWFPWIHIADTVGLIQWAIDADLVGPLNLVAPGIVRQGEFARALGVALHRPALVPAPAFALRLILGDGARVALEGQQVVPRVALDRGYAFRFPSLDGALADLLAS